MKIDLSGNVLDLAGNPLIGDGKESLKLSAVAINALLAPPANRESQPTGEQSLKRFTLAKKIQQNEQEYTVDEAALIKQCASKIWAPLVYGRLCEAIEGAD